MIWLFLRAGALRGPLRVSGVLAAILVLVLPPPARAAFSPEARCEAAKGRIVGKYAACMQSARAALATAWGRCSPGDQSCQRDADCASPATCAKNTAPGSTFASAVARCVTRFDKAWARAEESAAPDTCLDGLSPEDVRGEIDAGVDTVATALSGRGLESCRGDLGQCSTSLASCQSTLGQVQDNYLACSGIPAGCLASPGPECQPPADLAGGVAATPLDAGVRLLWGSVPGADAYRVERATAAGGPFVVVGRTSSTSFVDDTVTNDVEYRYRVVAVHNGFAGDASSPVLALPQAPPGPPSGFTVLSGNTQALLSWTPGSGAAATRIVRAPAPDGPWSEVTVTSAAEYTDGGLQNGVPYWYALFSRNPVGESARTAPVRGIPIDHPANLVAVPSDGQVALFWSPSLGASSYEVQRAGDAAGPWSAVGQSTLPRFADVGLLNGTPFFYRVAAHNPAGTSAPTDPVSATPAADAAAQLPPEDPTRNRIGLNVWFNADWSGVFPFVDVFKESRHWQDGSNWNNPVAGVDDHGWPTADASTVIFSGDAADFNGTYKLFFEGQADVSPMWCPGTVTNKTWNSETNTTQADVTFAMLPTQRSIGLIFRNTRRTPSSPLGSGFRNARLYRPGYPTDGSVVFTQPFLAALGRAGTVRMMEWTGGSSNVVTRWVDRVTPSHANQHDLPAPPYTAPDGQVYNSSLGVALEYQILLCNTLMTDCWINVPPAVDDEFVQNMALALRFGTDGRNPYTAPQANPVFPPLNPALRIYLEYSNETWNGGAGFYALQIIKAICAHLDASHPVMQPTPDSVYTAAWRYPAWRLWSIGEIFRNVFGDSAMLSRVRPVLMTQRGNAQSTLSTALLWFDGFLRGLPQPRKISEVFWAAGGSGYWGVNQAVSAVPDQFFASGNIPDATSVREFSIDAVWARNYGLRRVAYEGGPGLNYSGADNRNLNADPRMKDAVESVHDIWSSLGGDLLVYYVLRGPSEWEFTPAITQADSPKLLALQELQSRPRAPVSMGASFPGRITARDAGTTLVRTGWGYDTTLDGVKCGAGYMTGNFIAMAGHADAAYSGSLKFNGYAAKQSRVAVWINGERQGEVVLPVQTSGAHIYESSSVPVNVPAGLVVVRLEVIEGDMTVCSADL